MFQEHRRKFTPRHIRITVHIEDKYEAEYEKAFLFFQRNKLFTAGDQGLMLTHC